MRTYLVRISRLLFTLPIIAASTLVASQAPLWAAAAPLDALELLIKSKVVEAKCRTLDSAERDELSRYAARAEVAVTRMHSLTYVQDTIASGKILGSGIACGPAAAQEISETLAAARRAAALVDKARIPSDETPETPITLRRLASIDPATEPQYFRGGDLQAYGRQAMAYFVERRCAYLGQRTRDFHNEIVRRHQAAIRSYGSEAVSAVLRRSEAAANGVTCGKGRDLVASAYGEIQRH